MENIQNSLYGKTYPELLAAITDRTSEQCLKKSQKPVFQCLNLVDGLTQEWLEASDVTLHGESWMLNIGESPSVEKESFLWQILENPADVPEKYYLSSKATMGILRRASERGKILPKKLRNVLIKQSGLGGRKYGEKEITYASEILSRMWNEIGEKAFVEWLSGTIILLQRQAILLCEMLHESKVETNADDGCTDCESKQNESKKENTFCPMCYMRKRRIYGGSSQGQEPDEQLTREFNKVMQELSCQTAPYEIFMYCLWIVSKRTPSMLKALASMEEIKSAWMGYGIYIDDKGKVEYGDCNKHISKYSMYMMSGHTSESRNKRKSSSREVEEGSGEAGSGIEGKSICENQEGRVWVANHTPALATQGGKPGQGYMATVQGVDPYNMCDTGDVTCTLKTGSGVSQGMGPCVKTVGALCADDHKGINNQYVDQGKCVIEGADIYNHKLSGDKAVTLTTGSGTSAGHSGPSVIEGFDEYNFASTGEKSRALASRDYKGGTCAYGGEVSPTVTNKWFKGYGGPSGSECGNMVIE